MPPKIATSPTPDDIIKFLFDTSQKGSDMEPQIADSLITDAVCNAVIALAEALEPDGQYDPAHDPRPEAATEQLATLIGLPGARGVRQALVLLSTRR